MFRTGSLARVIYKTIVRRLRFHLLGNSFEKNNKKFGNPLRFTVNYFNLENRHFRFRTYSNGSSIVLLSFTLLLFPANTLLKFDNASATTGGITIPVYMMTTRDGSDPPRGEQGTGYDGRPLGDINQLRRDCPSQIAIFVHGWHNDDFKAKERLDRVRISLIENNYTIPLVGLSWPSDTGWPNAKIIAKQDGAKLAHFIVDYVHNCKHQQNKDTNIRLIGHSLGARVILSALGELHNTTRWTNEGFKILSVHLMGAAVDDEEVSKNPSDITGNTTIKSAYGNVIQGEVIRFYNLYNPEDNMLEPLPFYPSNIFYEIYPFFEQDSALGQAGTQQDIQVMDKVTTPPYYDIDIKNQIEPGTDADGIEDSHVVFCGVYVCGETVIEGWDFGLCLAYYHYWMIITQCNAAMGDNHAGYMGFRDNLANRNIQEYDGAMDIVVQHWLAPLN
jgi:hypothetical protein